MSLSLLGFISQTLAGPCKQGKLLGRALSLVMGEDIGCHQRHALLLGIHIGACLSQQHRVSIGCSIEVVEFVTHKVDGHQCTIGLRHLYQTAVGRNSQR